MNFELTKSNFGKRNQILATVSIENLDKIAREHIVDYSPVDWIYNSFEAAPEFGYYFPDTTKQFSLKTHHSIYVVTNKAVGLLISILATRQLLSAQKLTLLECDKDKKTEKFLVGQINKVNITDKERIAIYLLLN
jgi:hypothetical protein